MNKEKLIHRVTVKGDPKYRDLSSHERVKLIDQFINPESPKALIVDFDFSHTGRRINRRIYSKAGHIQTASDLVTPYFKPITLNHDGDAEKIIGRIVAASYSSLINDATQYFSNRGINPIVVNDLDHALMNLDFEKIRDLIKSNNLHKDKKWIGIGKVATKARITDVTAIEKFIDGRFQTFSAETDSDMYICSDCLQDWYKDGPCECGMPGANSFMMTGNMIGGGSSVVTHPADDLSIVTNMMFSDSALDINTSIEDIMLVDSTQQLIVVDEQEILMNDLIKKFALDQEMTSEEAETLYNWVFSHDEIKDAMVVEDDKEVKVADSKLTKKQRSALPKTLFAGTYRNFPVMDAGHVFIAQWLLRRTESILQDEVSASDEECEECIVELTEEEAKEVDWAKLDEELEAEVEVDSADAKLSSEARNKLSGKSFCGPDRSFPVPDCAHVTAAKRLIGRAKVSDSTKSKIMACVNKKAKSLGCGGSEDSISELIKSTIDRRAKAFGCSDTAQEVIKDLDQVKTAVKIVETKFALDALKSLDKDEFSKIYNSVTEVAKEFGISVSDTSTVETQLEDTKARLADIEIMLANADKQRDAADERYKAIRIEYKELFSDHKEIYRLLDSKDEIVDNLVEKIVKILGILKPGVDLTDKSIKNIHLLLDSLDLSSLESKLNDGLTHRQVNIVDDPTLLVGDSKTSSTGKLAPFEKKVVDQYKKLIADSNKVTADKWFDTKMSRYCSKDFHPSKFME